LSPDETRLAVQRSEADVTSRRNGVFYQSHIASDLNLDPNFSQVVGLGKSTNGGASFGAPIYTPPPPGANTTILFAFADKPFITTDTSAGPNAGTVYLTYTSFELSSSNVFSGVIRLSKSTDGGLTLSPPVAVSPLSGLTQGSQPAVGPRGRGRHAARSGRLLHQLHAH